MISNIKKNPLSVPLFVILYKTRYNQQNYLFTLRDMCINKIYELCIKSSFMRNFVCFMQTTCCNGHHISTVYLVYDIFSARAFYIYTDNTMQCHPL